MLLNGGAKALTVEHCSHLGISMSHSVSIKMQGKAAAPTNTKVATWKQDTLEKSLQINLFEEVLKKQPAAVVSFAKNEIENCDYFENSIYDECSALLHKAGAGNADQIYPRQVLVHAVDEIKRNINHYK